MSRLVFPAKHPLKITLSLIVAAVAVTGGCAVSAKNPEQSALPPAVKSEQSTVVPAEAKTLARAARIKISPNSPADAVRLFYKNLREKRFRDAIMMTNMRPAVESLSDAEMEDFRSDFEPIAQKIPAELEINGEIITNDAATVTAKMPNDETGNLELKEFKLRRENGSWVILWLDEETEKTVKREGKNYLFALRMDVHHVEAQSMMERVAKAQMVYAIQNGGFYADMKTLVDGGLLPADAQTPDSTGYRFGVAPSPDRKKYTATAEPAVYGKTGKLSYLLEMEGKDKKPRLKVEDNKGLPLKK